MPSALQHLKTFAASALAPLTVAVAPLAKRPRASPFTESANSLEPLRCQASPPSSVP